MAIAPFFRHRLWQCPRDGVTALGIHPKKKRLWLETRVGNVSPQGSRNFELTQRHFPFSREALLWMGRCLSQELGLPLQAQPAPKRELS